MEKISKFLGKDFSNETLDAITDHCTFANMKKNPMTQLDSLFAKLNLPDSMSFMRKGNAFSFERQSIPIIVGSVGLFKLYIIVSVYPNM